MLSSVDWQTIVDALQDGVGVLDEDGRIIHANQAAIAILGRSAVQLIGRTPLELDLGAMDENGSALELEHYPSAKAKRSGKSVREQTIGIQHPDGRLRWLSVSAAPMGAEARPAAAVLTFRDVTERRDYEAELHRLAEVDELTGLPNRRFVLRQLAAMLSRARRHDGTLSVLVVDADHFKALNDRHGHAAGDAVLRVLAERLGDRVRREDVVGRIGGEEFVVALPDTGPDGAAAVAEDLRSGVAAGPVRLPGVDVPVTVSVGWATWDGAEPLDGLLGRADRALYEAKAAGRDRVRPAPHGAAAR